MATIGTIKQNGNAFEGTLAMLSITSPIRLEPLLERRSDASPSHRVTVPGGGEIGAAWTKTSKNTGAEFLSIKLDAPELRDVVYCNTGPAANTDPRDGVLALIWNRS